MKQRQGTSDGLCGIYALAAIMRDLKVGPRGFGSKIIGLLEALPEGTFTPVKVGKDGFKVRELVSCLNRCLEGDESKTTAKGFRSYRKHIHEIGGVEALFEKGGRLISEEEDKAGHWVAILRKNQSGCFRVFDPYPKHRTKCMSEKEVMERARLIIGPQSFWDAF